MHKTIPHKIGTSFIHVILPGAAPYTLDKTHPTFKAMKQALERHLWARVPHLVTLAQRLSTLSHGKIKIEKGVALFNDKPILGYLGKRLSEIARRGESVTSLLKFSDNLMQNPDPETIPEVLEFLEASKMPITDDGCFLAYKCVNTNFTDCHSGKYDNSPGETPAMPRGSVDNDTRTACSSGFHFAALDYIRDGFASAGNRVVMIKINPKDVVAIPEYKTTKKGRVWHYEVVKELMTVSEAVELQDHPEMLQQVVKLGKERRELLKQVLETPSIKRAIRRNKIKKSTIMKQNYGQLSRIAAKYGVGKSGVSVDDIKVSPVLSKNPIKGLREKAKLTVRQVAYESGMSYKAVWAAEKAVEPTQGTIDKYLETINKLTGKDYEPVRQVKNARAAAASADGSSYSAPVEDSDTDYNDGGYEYEDVDD